MEVARASGGDLHAMARHVPTASEAAARGGGGVSLWRTSSQRGEALWGGHTPVGEMHARGDHGLVAVREGHEEGGGGKGAGTGEREATAVSHIERCAELQNSLAHMRETCAALQARGEELKERRAERARRETELRSRLEMGRGVALTLRKALEEQGADLTSGPAEDGLWAWWFQQS